MLITSKVLAKPKTILVQLASMAGTGTKLLHIRDRVAPKTVLLRFDKAVGEEVLFVETKKIKSIKEPIKYKK